MEAFYRSVLRELHKKIFRGVDRNQSREGKLRPPINPDATGKLDNSPECDEYVEE